MDEIRSLDSDIFSFYEKWMAKKEKEQINKNTLQHAEVFASCLRYYVIKHKVIHCSIQQCKEFCLSSWLWRSLLQLKRSLLSLPESY